MILNKKITEQLGICLEGYLGVLTAGYIHDTDIEDNLVYEMLANCPELGNFAQHSIEVIKEQIIKSRYLFEDYKVVKFHVFDPINGTHIPFLTLEEANSQRSIMFAARLVELDKQITIHEECEYYDGTTQLKPRVDFSEYPQDLIDAHIESLKNIFCWKSRESRNQ